MIIGLLESHDLGFDLVLAVTQSLTSDADGGFGFGRRCGLLEITNNPFKFMEIAINIFIKINRFN